MPEVVVIIKGTGANVQVKSTNPQAEAKVLRK